MNRRAFMALGVGATAAHSLLWPLAAHAQQGGKPVRIGFFGPSLKNPTTAINFQAFLAQLHTNGYSEGQNVIIEHGGVDDGRGPFVASAELMRKQPELIVAAGPEVALQAVIGASIAVPIVVIAINYDPVARGYVAGLARPGGNITGVVFQQLELAQKQVELMKEAFPGRGRLAILWDAQSADQFGVAERTAKTLQMQSQSLRLENPPYNVDDAFRTAVSGGAEMMLVCSSPMFLPFLTRIPELAVAHRLPTMVISKFWTEAGGLMSYGVDFPLMYRRAADQVAKILKGAKPADLPIELANKFDLVVNLKTAKAIGVELPTSILLRADQVIE